MQDKRSAEDNRHRENESYVEKEMIMQNYRFLIAYDGTRYHGWEHKKDVVTIQGKIESVLSLMAGEEVRINGAKNRCRCACKGNGRKRPGSDR